MNKIFLKYIVATVALLTVLINVASFAPIALAAWIEPSITPPGGDISQPVDVSSSLQAKPGDLELRDTSTGISLFATSSVLFGSVVVGGDTSAINYPNGIKAGLGDARAERLCLGVSPDEVCLTARGGDLSGNTGDRLLKWNASGKFLYSNIYDTTYGGVPSLIVGTSTNLMPVKASGRVTLKSDGSAGGNLFLWGLNSTSRGDPSAMDTNTTWALSMNDSGDVVLVKIPAVVICVAGAESNPPEHTSCGTFPATCPANGIKTRPCTFKYTRADCTTYTGAGTERQACCPTATTVCGDWSSCGFDAQCSNTRQTRTCTAVPSGCAAPNTSRTCTIDGVIDGRPGSCVNGRQDVPRLDTVNNDRVLCSYIRACTALPVPTISRTATCNSGATTATAVVTVSGATSNYLFEWSLNQSNWSSATLSGGTNYSKVLTSGQILYARVKQKTGLKKG